MATYTAGDLINRALRLIGELAEGETPSASTSQDALVAFDQMIDSWNTERLSVFATIDQQVTWPASQITESLGPTGTLGTPGTKVRPVDVDPATYFRDPGTGISYPIQIINQEQYDSIALKTVTSTYPEVLFVNSDFPNINMYIYPVANKDLEWHFISVSELTQPAALATALSFPPGYLRAFTYNLALEFAPEFGVEPSAQVKRVAMVSKMDLKRINDPGDVLSFPKALISTTSRFNIYTGQP